jgi:hypothetical protein
LEKVIHSEPVTEPARFLASWAGLHCDKVFRHENCWQFVFGNAQGIVAECPWRILDSGCIAHADEDDGQKFGLPNPVVGADRAQMLLENKKIISAEIAPISGDLKVHFESGTILEFFNNSSGYESWQASAAYGSGRVRLVAQGGGQISMWNDER